MKYNEMREELKAYYYNDADRLSLEFNDKCCGVLDEKCNDSMNAYQMKALQYKVISEMCNVKLFANSPFFYETGTMGAHCDGAGEFRWGLVHPGGWTFRHNQHIVFDSNPEAMALYGAHRSNNLYLVCGPSFDARQHFCFNYRPVFEGGLLSLYNKAKKALEGECTDDEKFFLETAMTGLVCMKKIADKFADEAEKRLANSCDEQEKENMRLISSVARRVPWEAPKTFFEALCTLAFIRKAIGTLEGIGPNTFGRLDVDLYPFYKNDIENGVTTYDKALEDVRKFLITWDCHYNHDMKMEGYADHELENTYVLGGYGADGKDVFNDVTKMFLVANREEKIIFPKIKCRFTKTSPKEYLDLINEPVINSTSTILYQNDEMCIPALVRAGRTLEDARDYVITGCWGMHTYGNASHEGGNYVNLLRIFEYTVHAELEKIKENKLDISFFDKAQSFEELYGILMENIRKFLIQRNDVVQKCASVRELVDPLPLLSASLDDCIARKKDYTRAGCRYNDEDYLFIGLPNIVDSLLAIKELCFDKKIYTLKEFLHAVRNNWENAEVMRKAALSCPFWGDESEASCSLAGRFNDDLYDGIKDIRTRFDGKIIMGHLTYTEIRWWAMDTKATPDGRHDGEYFAQGITPSRLHSIKSATAVVNCGRYIDFSKCAANSVVNMLLPHGAMTLDTMEVLLRVVAQSGYQSLQLNCVSKEQLLDAQKHPEKYGDLIVRVTGFSAKFTALSKEWQEEVLSRNFYE